MSCWTFKIKPISPKVSINATVRFPAQAVFRRRFYGGSMSIFVAIFPITSDRHIFKSNLTVCGSFSALYWTTRSIRANILKDNHNGCRRFKSPQCMQQFQNSSSSTAVQLLRRLFQPLMPNRTRALSRSFSFWRLFDGFGSRFEIYEKTWVDRIQVNRIFISDLKIIFGSNSIKFYKLIWDFTIYIIFRVLCIMVRVH